MTTKPLLNIELEEEPKNVVINGTPYELVEIQRFELRDIRRFQILAAQMIAFYAVSNDMSDETLDAFDALLRDSIPLILPDIPDALRDRFTLVHRMEIVKVFLEESGLLSKEQSETPITETPEIPGD